MENTTYTYEYSAKKNQEVKSIRDKYQPREETKLERLRRLDKKVQGAGVIESLAVGIVGSLVFGIGMCFGLDVFGGADWLTLLFGGLGAVIMLPAYAIYKRIKGAATEKYAPEIIKLSDEIIAEREARTEAAEAR